MARWMSRRRLVGAMMGVLLGSSYRSPAEAAGESTLDYCYWRNEQWYTCSGGTRYEKWCYYCNDPGTDWDVGPCEWRPVGSC